MLPSKPNKVRQKYQSITSAFPNSFWKTGNKTILAVQLTSSALYSQLKWQQSSCSSARVWLLNYKFRNQKQVQGKEVQHHDKNINSRPWGHFRTPLGSKYAATHTPSLDIKTSLHMHSCKSFRVQTSIGRAAWGFHKEKVWQSQNEPSAVLDSSTMQPSLPTLGVRGSSTPHPPQPLLSTQQLFWYLKFYQY